MTKDEVRAKLDDREAVALTLYGEAAGEAIVGKLAVACSIRNRVKADLGGDGKPDWWGEGYKGVCLKAWQYSCWWEDGAPNTERLYKHAEALVTGALNPALSPLFGELGWIADGAIGDALRDMTEGSTHYCTQYLYAVKPPKWAVGRKPTVTYGSHHFFANVEN